MVGSFQAGRDHLVDPIHPIFLGMDPRCFASNTHKEGRFRWGGVPRGWSVYSLGILQVLTMTRLIYLHGLRAKHSNKPALLATIPGVKVEAPEINDWDPKAVEALVRPLLKPHSILIGSSLGGLFAYGLAVRNDRMAFLLNPVTRPLDLPPAPFRLDFQSINRWFRETGPHQAGQVEAIVAQDDEVVDPVITAIDLGKECIIPVKGGHRLTMFEGFLPKVESFVRRAEFSWIGTK